MGDRLRHRGRHTSRRLNMPHSRSADHLQVLAAPRAGHTRRTPGRARRGARRRAHRRSRAPSPAARPGRLVRAPGGVVPPPGISSPRWCASAARTARRNWLLGDAPPRAADLECRHPMQVDRPEAGRTIDMRPSFVWLGWPCGMGTSPEYRGGSGGDRVDRSRSQSDGTAHRTRQARDGGPAARVPRSGRDRR